MTNFIQKDLQKKKYMERLIYITEDILTAQSTGVEIL